jgi:hypothetical protein
MTKSHPLQLSAQIELFVNVYNYFVVTSGNAAAGSVIVWNVRY